MKIARQRIYIVKLIVLVKRKKQRLISKDVMIVMNQGKKQQIHRSFVVTLICHDLQAPCRVLLIEFCEKKTHVVFLSIKFILGKCRVLQQPSCHIQDTGFALGCWCKERILGVISSTSTYSIISCLLILLLYILASQRAN